MQQHSSPNVNPPEEDSPDPLENLDDEENLSILEGSGDELPELRAPSSPSPSPSTRLDWMDS
ncbi:hypothetical protein, partial [Enterobacter hormaechei]|uniref:hypothetical protein n=1 Tax=Enterobacter hormaechei TaxID=158836 RepID=UPI0022EC6D2D